MDAEGKLQRLLRLAALRVRSQRFVEATCAALAAALAVTAIAICLTKWGWLLESELRLLVIVGAVIVLVFGAVAAALPLSQVSLLVRLDHANDLPDRLSSAWDFLRRPPESRTAEMDLHIERTDRDMAGIRVRPAFPYGWPVHGRMVLALSVLVALVAMVSAPSYDPIVRAAAPPPYAEVIVDTGRLLEDMRNIELLNELAGRTDDPELQAISRELDELVTRLQQGTISEEEMLDILEELDERIAALDEPEEPVDLGSVWEDIAEELEATLDELGVEPGSEARQRAESLLEALEEGDEEAIAEAMEDLADLLEQMDLDPEDVEDLADLLERFADLIDPTDIDLRQEMEDLGEQIAELEERVANRSRRRDQRRLDDAREALEEAESRLEQERQNQDAAGEVQQDLSEALQEAADQLREERSEQAGSDDAEAGETDREISEQDRETDAEGREIEHAQADREGTEPQDPQADGDTNTDGDEQETGESGSQEQADQRPPEQERGETASDALREAAETVDELDQREANEEARERAEQATSDLRENLQRSSHGESNDNEELAENWESFMNRAEGQEMGSADEQTGEPGDSDQGSWQTTESDRDGENPSDGGWRNEEGGDPLGDEATELDSERVRERVGVEGDESELTSSEVFQDVATSGFASTSYREVYAEYARAAEEVLEAEEIPRGYLRFVQQYFRLVEPR